MPNCVFSSWLWRNRTLKSQLLRHFSDVITITTSKNVPKIKSQNFSILGPPIKISGYASVSNKDTFVIAKRFNCFKALFVHGEVHQINEGAAKSMLIFTFKVPRQCFNLLVWWNNWTSTTSNSANQSCKSGRTLRNVLGRIHDFVRTSLRRPLIYE